MTKEIGIVEIANMVDGKIIGNFKEIRIAGTCAIDKYVENKISFIQNKKYEGVLAPLQKAIILIPKDLIKIPKKYPQNCYIIVEDVLKSLMDLQDFFYNDLFIIIEEGIAKTAKIDSTAKIGRNVYLGENIYIGKNVIISEDVKILHNSVIFDDVVIGNGTYIYPNVCIYENCEIGEECIIHSGVQIGIDGFRFKQNSDQKSVRKMLHVGKVVIGGRVEIGANSTIDRATFQDAATILSDDVKIDDQVHIGHNAKIGARTCIAAQTCISGSAKIGEDVFAGAGVTVSDGVNIGNRAKLLLNAVVAYDVPEDGLVSGFYAMPHRQWKRVFNKLKEI
jgi:UDP-3-O-[3-hydroxymyristoyl] glucosamine N-acyltransferase